MTPDETEVLLAYITSLDGRNLTDLSPAAWADVLSDVHYADAKDAVREHQRTSTEWLTPAHVVQGARRIARERAEAFDRRRHDETTISCGRPGCLCTHSLPCVGGWIDSDTDGLYASTKPCLTCRPEVAAILRDSPDTHDGRMTMGHELRARGGKR